MGPVTAMEAELGDLGQGPDRMPSLLLYMLRVGSWPEAKVLSSGVLLQRPSAFPCCRAFLATILTQAVDYGHPQLADEVQAFLESLGGKAGLSPPQA